MRWPQGIRSRLTMSWWVPAPPAASWPHACRKMPPIRSVLLEAGGNDNHFWIHVPLGFGKTFADPKVNWMFETEPDPTSGGRRMYWPRGKVLGGSSSINGMIYIRGQHEDFDHWRQLGNPGWSSTDVLPYFKRSESQERGGDDFHGSDGPLAVSDVRYTHPICDAFIEAAVELGFPRNNDFNGKVQEGVGYQQTTTRNGKRWSTAVGYLKPSIKRPNLHVITGALTERVIFEGKRAVGIAFQEAGVAGSIRARKEVILCGGAIGSPHILLLSGVGPAEHLREHGIEVVHPLPGVGQSLQDHYSGAVKLRCNQKITLKRRHAEQRQEAGCWAGLYPPPSRATDNGRRPRRSVRTHPAGAGLTRCEVHALPVQRRQPCQGASRFLRLHPDRLSVAAGQPGRIETAQRRSEGHARDVSELPARRRMTSALSWTV